MARNEFSGIDEESYADGLHDGQLDAFEKAALALEKLSEDAARTARARVMIALCAREVRLCARGQTIAAEKG